MEGAAEMICPPNIFEGPLSLQCCSPLFQQSCLCHLFSCRHCYLAFFSPVMGTVNLWAECLFPVLASSLSHHVTSLGFHVIIAK